MKRNVMIKLMSGVLAVSMVVGSLPVQASELRKSKTTDTGAKPIVYLDMEDVLDGQVINKADNQKFRIEGEALQKASIDGFGQALKFDGSSNYINLGTEYQVEDAYTLAAWVNVDPKCNSLAKITGRGRTGIPGEKDLALYIRKNVGRLECEGATTEGFMSDNDAVKLGSWQHVAVTHDGKDTSLYVNGKLVKSGDAGTKNMHNEEVALLVGAGWNGTGTAPFADHMFKGLIDELCLFDTALSTQEIADLTKPMIEEPEEMPEAKYEFTMDEVQDGTGENAGKKVIVNNVNKKEYVLNGSYRVDDFGIYGKSLEFNGTDTYINLGNAGIKQTYTMEAWVNIKPEGGNSLNKMFGGDRTTHGENAFYFCVRNNGNIELMSSNDSHGSAGIESGPDHRVTFDAWKHLAITCDGHNYKLYLDGEKIAETYSDADIDLSKNPNPLLIGCGWNAEGTGIFNGHAFKGRMDDVKIFDEALTEAQVKKSTEGIKIPPEIKGIEPSEKDLLDPSGDIKVLYNMPVTLGTNAVILMDETGNTVTEIEAVIEEDTKLVVTPKNSLSPGHSYLLSIPTDAIVNEKGIGNLYETSYRYHVSIDLAGDSGSSTLGNWVNGEVQTASMIEEKDSTLTMSNGIVERTFDLSKDFMTTSYKNLYTGIELLESSKLQADGEITLNDHYTDAGEGMIRYQIGGSDSDFEYTGYITEEQTEEIYHWQYDPRISDPAMKDTPWPAKGKAVIVSYRAKETVEQRYQGVSLQVRYEIYDGIPVICKSIEVTNTGDEDVIVQHLKTEVLPVKIENKEALYMESNFNGSNANHDRNNGRYVVAQWEEKEDYGQQISQYAYQSYGQPVTKEFGPAYRLKKDQKFQAFRIYELFQSSSYYEWKQLEVKKMYRVLFPQSGDNPLIYHLISSDTTAVRNGIDQAKAAGFNMVLLSFGSGVNVEDTSEGNIKKYKELCDYAEEKGIMLGSYTMMTARGDQGDDESLTGVWGRMRCMTSKSAETSISKTLEFVRKTGMDVLEIDGTYPNERCNAVAGTHVGHEGTQDSVVKQFEMATQVMMKDLRETNVYLNAPDWMFMCGANKAVMGYKEGAFGSARANQLIYGREIGYYGTFGKMPSMGWTLVPFSSYNGGDGAVFWPYDERINDYDSIIALNMLYGIGGSYRGANGLYQGAPSQNVMKTWGSFFDKYRGILDADVIHIKPPVYDVAEGANVANCTTTKDIDGFIHASAIEEQKGLGVFFNQTGRKVTKKIQIPLYYTGLTNLNAPPAPVQGSHYLNTMRDETGDWYTPAVPTIKTPQGQPTDKKAVVCFGDMNGQEYTIDSNGNIELELEMEPGSYVWFTVYDPADAPDPQKEIGQPENLKAIPSANTVTLTWDAVEMDGRPVKDYNIYRNREFSGKTFTNSYTDKSAEAETDYVYEIVPVHNTVAGSGTEINTSTKVDNTAPILNGVKALDSNTLELTFSERLEEISAGTEANYHVAGITVNSAVQDTDGKTVELKLEPELAAFEEYEVTVDGVKDLAGNSIASNTKGKAVFGNLREFDFNEEDGAVAIERINGVNGTIGGTPVREKGIAGNALQFDGSHTYVEIGHVVDELDKYGISFWFKTDDVEKEQTLIGQQREFYNDYISNLYLKDNSISYTLNNGKAGTAQEKSINLSDNTGKVKAGKWNHAAVVRGGDTFTLYVNGEKADTVTQTGIDQSQNPYTMWLGGFKNNAGGEPTKQFKGLMDEVKFYNTDITEEKVKSIFDTENPELDNLKPIIDFNMDTYTEGKITNTANGKTYSVKASLGEGIDGQALIFDGKTAVNIGTDFKPSKAYTMMAWINQDLGGGACQAIAARGNSGNGTDQLAMLIKDKGIYHCVAYSDGTGNSKYQEKNVPLNLNMGEWKHIAVTFDGSNLTYYVNGKEAFRQENFAQGGFADTSMPMYIGADCASNGTLWYTHGFKGRMDNVQLYDTALTAEQVKQSGMVNHSIGELTAKSATVLFEENPLVAPKLEDFTVGFTLDGKAIQNEITEYSYNEATRTAAFQFPEFKNKGGNEKELSIFIMYKGIEVSASIKLEPLNTGVPSAKDLKIVNRSQKLGAQPHVKGMLEVNYTYSDPDNDVEDNTKYQWTMADSADGTYSKLPGIRTKTILLLDEYVGKYLKCEVTVSDINGDVSAVPAVSPASEPILATEGNPLTDWFYEEQYGAIHHLLPEFVDKDFVSTNPGEKWDKSKQTWNEFIGEFDVEKYAADLSQTGVKYAVITLGQNAAQFNAPNEAYDKYLREAGLLKEGEVNPKTVSPENDLPMRMADALAPYGIKVMLYLPSNPPHSAHWDEEAKDYKVTTEVFKYTPGRDSAASQEAKKVHCELVQWWSEHYGDKISGWWFDGMYPGGPLESQLDMTKEYNVSTLANAAKAGNPYNIVSFNQGTSSQWLYKKSTPYHDYTAGESNNFNNFPSTGRWAETTTDCQMFQFGPLGTGGWGWGAAGIAHNNDYVETQLREGIKRQYVMGFDIKVNHFGTIDPEQLAQLKEVNKRVNGEHTVTVTSGTANKTTALKGELITLTAAKAPEGKVFDKWITTGKVSLADTTKPATTFVMPGEHVTAEAVYKDDPSIIYANEIKLEPEEITLVTGEEAANINVTILPENVTNGAFTTLSANSSVASAVIENKTIRITAVKSGSTSVKVTALGTRAGDVLTKEIKVTVLHADLTQLQSLYNAVSQMDTSIYTQESAAALNTALKRAEAVLAKEDATKEEAAEAESELLVAMAALDKKEAQPGTDKSLAKALHSTYRNLDLSVYTPESAEIFQDALTGLQRVIDKTDATQEEVDQSIGTLLTAATTLKRLPETPEVPEIPVDFSVLKILYQAYEGINTESYTKESAEIFREALLQAEKVIKNEAADQTTVDQAAAALAKAAAQLTQAPEEPTITTNTSTLKILYQAYGGLDLAKYTDTSAKVMKEAITQAAQVLNNTKATQTQVDQAASKLMTAATDLELKPIVPKPEPPKQTSLKKGQIHTYKGIKYKITNPTQGKATVTAVGAASKNVKKVTIPSTVTLKGVTCKVTAIGEKAFKNYKKLQQITIGANVTTIGAQAFYGDSHLKSIIIKTKGLKKASSNCLKGIATKAVIKVPKSKVKAYKKIFKNRGQKNSVVIK